MHPIGRGSESGQLVLKPHLNLKYKKRLSRGISARRPAFSDKCWSSTETVNGLPSLLKCEDDGTVLRLYKALLLSFGFLVLVYAQICELFIHNYHLLSIYS